MFIHLPFKFRSPNQVISSWRCGDPYASIVGASRLAPVASATAPLLLPPLSCSQQILTKLMSCSLSGLFPLESLPLKINMSPITSISHPANPFPFFLFFLLVGTRIAIIVTKRGQRKSIGLPTLSSHNTAIFNTLFRNVEGRRIANNYL